MADVPQRFFYIQLRTDRKRTEISEKCLFDDAEKAGYKKIEGSVWMNNYKTIRCYKNMRVV